MNFYSFSVSELQTLSDALTQYVENACEDDVEVSQGERDSVKLARKLLDSVNAAFCNKMGVAV